MKYTKFSYTPVGKDWQKKVEEVEETTPLTQAVEQLADANPGKIVVGTEYNGEVVDVRLLEEM